MIIQENYIEIDFDAVKKFRSLTITSTAEITLSKLMLKNQNTGTYESVDAAIYVDGNEAHLPFYFHTGTIEIIPDLLGSGLMIEGVGLNNISNVVVDDLPVQDVDYSGVVAGEAKERADGDEALLSAINAEATARSVADINEASARAAADSTLQSAIDAKINYCQLPMAFESGFGASVTRYVTPAYYNVSSVSGDMRYPVGDRDITIHAFTILGRPATSPAQNYTHTFTLRVNGVDTAMSGTITVTPAGGIGYYELTVTTGAPITVAAGSWIDIKCVIAGNGFIKFSGNILIGI